MSVMLNPKARCESITHDSINFSPTKQKYSFSKDKRFSMTSGRTPSEFNHDLPSSFRSRRLSFGVGERFKSLSRNSKLHVIISRHNWSIEVKHLSMRQFSAALIIGDFATTNDVL